MFKFRNKKNVWHDAHNMFGRTPTMGFMPTPNARRFTDTSLCLHNKLKIGSVATFLYCHDMEMSTRYVSNGYISTFKNITYQYFCITPNVNGKKWKKMCLKLDHTVMHSPIA